MSKVSQNDTVRKIQNREVDQITTPKTTKEAIERGVPLVMAERVTGVESILYALEMELANIIKLVNVDSRLNIQSHQTRVIAETILDNFKTESFDDFKLAFARGAAGFYGEIFRLDGAVLVRWIQCYLEDKYTIVDSAVHSIESDKDAQVDYGAFQKRLEEQRERDRKEHEEELRQKREAAENFTKGLSPKGYKPPSKEEIALRDIHNLWIASNYDRMGKKKPTWEEEEEWIEKNAELIKQTLKAKAKKVLIQGQSKFSEEDLTPKTDGPETH